jgi:hypothetical protein
MARKEIFRFNLTFELAPRKLCVQSMSTIATMNAPSFHNLGILFSSAFPTLLAHLHSYISAHRSGASKVLLQIFEFGCEWRDREWPSSWETKPSATTPFPWNSSSATCSVNKQTEILLLQPLKSLSG